jgi:hypothetical protein
MPTQSRLMLAVTDATEILGAPETLEDEAPKPSTHVFDVFDNKDKYASTADAVRSALRSVPRAGVPQELLAAMFSALSSAPKGSQVSQVSLDSEAGADVELQELGLRMQGVSARGALQEGTASFVVSGQLLPTAARVLRAEAEAGGLRLSLVALVHRTGRLSTGRPAFHFVGSPAGRLVDVRALRVGKKSAAATTGSSHYMRRAGQLQAHAAAMQDLGVALHVPETQRAHTPLLDAYVSRAEHAGRPLLCVSVFA